MMLAIRSKGESGLDILGSEFRKIGEDFHVTHSGRQPAKNIIDGNAHVPDTGFSSPFPGFNGDALALVLHGMKNAPKCRVFQVWTEVGGRREVGLKHRTSNS